MCLKILQISKTKTMYTYNKNNNKITKVVKIFFYNFYKPAVPIAA